MKWLFPAWRYIGQNQPKLGNMMPTTVFELVAKFFLHTPPEMTATERLYVTRSCNALGSVCQFPPSSNYVTYIVLRILRNKKTLENTIHIWLRRSRGSVFGGESDASPQICQRFCNRPASAGCLWFDDWTARTDRCSLTLYM